MTLARSPFTTLMRWCAILIVIAGSSLLSGPVRRADPFRHLGADPAPSSPTRSAPSGKPVTSDPCSGDLERTGDADGADRRLLRSPSFSPEGDRLAFICTLSGSPQVWTAPVEGGWPTQVTAYEDPVGNVVWSPRGDWLAVSVAPGGGMNAQIFLVRPDGLEQRRITDGGKENNWLGRWSDDGGLLTLSSNRDNPAGDGLVSSTTCRRRGCGSWSGTRGSVRSRRSAATGRRIIVNRMRSRGDDNLYLYDSRRSVGKPCSPSTMGRAASITAASARTDRPSTSSPTGIGIAPRSPVCGSTRPPPSEQLEVLAAAGRRRAAVVRADSRRRDGGSPVERRRTLGAGVRGARHRADMTPGPVLAAEIASRPELFIRRAAPRHDDVGLHRPRRRVDPRPEPRADAPGDAQPSPRDRPGDAGVASGWFGSRRMTASS